MTRGYSTDERLETRMLATLESAQERKSEFAHPRLRSTHIKLPGSGAALPSITFPLSHRSRLIASARWRLCGPAAPASPPMAACAAGKPVRLKR